VLTVDRDLAASLGRILVDEIGVDAPSLICIDNIDAGGLDYLDVGRPAPPAGVVPVVIKSLLFDAARPRRPAPATAEEPA
jgi:ethanolamine utilization protein EutA